MVPSTRGLTELSELRDVESLSEAIQWVSDDRVPLNAEPESGWEKDRRVNQARMLYFFLGYPACSGELYPDFTTRA